MKAPRFNPYPIYEVKTWFQAFHKRNLYTALYAPACLSVLRVMRAYTGRTKIIKFEGCYHGGAAVQVASSRPI
jgi:hypothetical protein